MANERRNVLNLMAVSLRIMNQIITDSSSSSESSNEDEELQALEHLDGLQRTVIPRLENYVKHVLPALTSSDQEFKSHFRYLLYYNSLNLV